MTSIKALYEIFLDHPEISTDTRKITGGSLFFALKGPNFNANEFAGEALEKEASYVVIDEEKYKKNEKCLLVDDVLTTLQNLAVFHRKKLNIPVIGITGSNGKTTTKELIREVLNSRFSAFATEGNLNNHIGVPLSVLSINNKHEIAVIEMGANHRHEIERLCKICLPEYGIITNIGKAHIEGFGSYEGVIQAKRELYDFIENNKGKLFVNADNELLTDIAPDVEQLLYGKGQNNYCRGELTSSSPFVELSWECNSNSTGKQSLKSNLYGKYNFENILAAVCIGNYFNVPVKDINLAIENYRPSNNRSQIIHTDNQTIFQDAYNANPTSMKSAIETFASTDHEKKVLILGDMLELGPDSEQEHRSTIGQLQDLGLHEAILVGKEFQKTAGTTYPSFSNYKEAIAFLKEKNLDGYAILIKGSRGIQLEKITKTLFQKKT